jgi:hypothetical protein
MSRDTFRDESIASARADEIRDRKRMLSDVAVPLDERIALVLDEYFDGLKQAFPQMDDTLIANSRKRLEYDLRRTDMRMRFAVELHVVELHVAYPSMNEPTARSFQQCLEAELNLVFNGR